MSESLPEPQPAPDSPPEVIERGRYAVYEAPDGGWVVARSTTCDDCRTHGCGEQGDPIMVPGMIVALAKQAQASGGMSPAKMLKGLMGRG